MKVKKVVIHEIIKESGDKTLTRNMSSTGLSITPDLEKMIEHLVNSFEDSNLKYGKFRGAKDTAFSLNANKFIKSNTDKDFFDFTRLSVNELVVILENILFATGGYYLFFEYENNGTTFISILIIRNKEAFKIDWVNGSFEIDETANINLDKIAMGLRINCRLLSIKDSSRNYIALVTNQGDTLSDYFLNWTNVDITSDSSKSTEDLVNAIRLIEKPKGTDQHEFRRKAFDWILQYKKMNNGIVNIDKLSEYLLGDKNAIKKYASSNNIDIDTELKVYSSKLRALVKYNAKSKGISLSFSVEDMDSGDIQINSKDKVVTITNNSIFDKLKDQIDNGTK